MAEGRWSYKVVTWGGALSDESFEAELNHLGDEGWEAFELGTDPQRRPFVLMRKQR